MGLGEVTNITEGARATYAPRTTAWGASSVGQTSGIPDDDSALAVIRNLHRAEIFGVSQGGINSSDPTFRDQLKSFVGTFRESLSAYKELAKEIESGRFSPDALRELVQAVDGTPGKDFWAGVPGIESTGPLSSPESSGPAEAGSSAPRALSWLKYNFKSVLMSQQDIEPGRVLQLLRNTINPEAAS
ncbi:MAG TPA: hypothetical protein ENI81_08760 [Phycisphaerales bacterium]|nr:hypothetical protein [Phycisphaerales bacterium]